MALGSWELAGKKTQNQIRRTRVSTSLGWAHRRCSMFTDMVYTSPLIFITGPPLTPPRGVSGPLVMPRFWWVEGMPCCRSRGQQEHRAGHVVSAWSVLGSA